MLHLDISDMGIKSYASLKPKLEKIRKADAPPFERYKEDIPKLKEAMKRYRRFRNLILIGNGGSNTSMKAFHKALVPLDSRKGFEIIDTMEPDFLKEVKDKYGKWKTLVMPISKSGTTIGILEAMFAFDGYKFLPITSPNKAAMHKIATELKWRTIDHPVVGGRYSGLTACAFAPALFFGIDVAEIEKGARGMYKKCNPSVSIEKNPALQLAASLYLLERKGYSEIFCPVYSKKLSGFKNLIVQLMHESVCKKGHGQTIYCADAPESQHHTNQRFFGGKKNVLGLFITVETQDDDQSRVRIPDFSRDISIRSGKLGDIDNVPYAHALNFEFKGTYQDAVNNKIPCAHVELDRISPESVGEFLGFWHYVAVYSSMLRDVNPYDQPHVESSKELSFKLRQQYEG
ncbi:hypothetical protein KY362_01855 [Candidatus Woesearchaeota archaeon]|nr:hypothetical protein [Candidatus Woesearchaeota archaeon]